MGRPDLIKPLADGGDQLPNDPRYGVWGNFARKTSIDELPQLFNVLIGDISLVGPRALIPQEINAYEKKHAILNVKSGITGLAQVSGRRDLRGNSARTNSCLLRTELVISARHPDFAQDRVASDR